MTWIEEFKAFIQRGNVIDLAVAVVMGAAFNKIVNSLVNDILSPILGIATRDGNIFSGLDIPLYGGVDLKLGAFLQAVLNFFIIAFCVFLLVKGMNTLHRKMMASQPKPMELSTQEKLLTEIRDLLKAKANDPPRA
jgi:large conductance mechanosensitive channel